MAGEKQDALLRLWPVHAAAAAVDHRAPATQRARFDVQRHDRIVSALAALMRVNGLK